MVCGEQTLQIKSRDERGKRGEGGGGGERHREEEESKELVSESGEKRPRARLDLTVPTDTREGARRSGWRTRPGGGKDEKDEEKDGERREIKVEKRRRRWGKLEPELQGPVCDGAPPPWTGRTAGASRVS